MKRFALIIVIAAIVAIIVNDGGRYAQGVIDLHNSTQQVLDQAGTRARGADTATGQFGATLATLAAAQGITVTQFAVTPQAVHIWTSEPVTGTWVLGPYLAMAKGTPWKTALHTPLVISYDAEGAVR